MWTNKIDEVEGEANYCSFSICRHIISTSENAIIDVYSFLSYGDPFENAQINSSVNFSFWLKL